MIHVEKIGKLYKLCRSDGTRYKTLRDSLSHWWKSGGDGVAKSSPEDFWALKDVSFEVGKGEAVGIIGSNGAGKSTLLKVLARITEPTSGRIVLNGRMASLLEVGTGFHPELTGRENIYMNAAILGMPRSELRSRFDEIVAFAEVERFLDIPVKRYSSGMFVRLAFSVAAHLEPDILVVDEVLAVGDASFQSRCLGKLRDVANNSGRTVLFVSHDLGAVRTLTTRCLLLKQGRLVMDGEPAAVIKGYLASNLTGADWKDLSHSPRPVECTGEARFRSILVKSDPVTIGNGGDLRLDVLLESKNVLDTVCVSLTVQTEEGTNVGSSFSAPQLQLNSGSQAIQVCIPLPNLAPGRYCCTLAVSRSSAGMTTVIDAVSNTALFEVVPAHGERTWQASWGACRLGTALVNVTSAIQAVD